MTVGVVTIHVGGMTEADVMIAGQSTLDIAIQQSGERRLARTTSSTKVRGTMCGERGRDDGVDVKVRGTMCGERGRDDGVDVRRRFEGPCVENEDDCENDKGSRDHVWRTRTRRWSRREEEGQMEDDVDVTERRRGGRWLSSSKRARVIIAQTLPIDRED